MPDALEFRDADPSEDDELARIMYNAFLPIWNHNWLQCLNAQLDPLPSVSSPRSRLQARRLAFYRSWISVVRWHKGDVTVAYTPAATTATGESSSVDHGPHPSSSSSSSPPPPSTSSPLSQSPIPPAVGPLAAVCLLLPPHARFTWGEPLVAWRTGLLQGVFGLSLRGVWRVITFEDNVHRMIAQGLAGKGLKDDNDDNKNKNNNKSASANSVDAKRAVAKDERDLMLCHGCVRNPEWQGRAPARRLLDWAVRRRWRAQRAGDDGEGKGKGKGTGCAVPCWLDTTTDEAVRAYEEVGFKLVGECMLDTGGTDEAGIKLRKDAASEDREKGRKVAKQRVMIKLPDEAS